MTCLVYLREVDKNACGFYTKNGYICCNCEDAEIGAFEVRIPGCQTFIANGPKDALDFLENEFIEGDCENEITVKRSKMKAIQYYNLGEWEG